MRKILLLVLASCFVLTGRGERLPVEDFSHEEAYSGMVLSPDGKVVAYDETIKVDQRLFMLEIDSGKKLRVEMEGSDRAWSHYAEFFWVNNRRLVFRAGGSYAALDRDGKNTLFGLSGAGVLYLFRDEEAGMMLMSAYDRVVGEGMSRVTTYVPRRPYILKVNSRMGMPMREVENPGNVVAWGINPKGVVTVAVEIKGTHFRVVYRGDEKASWKTLPGMDWGDLEVRPQGFSADGNTLYVTRVTPKGTWGIYPYNLNQHRLGEPLLANERYDIVPGYSLAYANGYLQQALIFSPKERELLGIRYQAEFPRMRWLDPELAQVQEALDQALPKKINTITSMSDDRQRMIVLSWSASDPGTYYLFDRTNGKLGKLVARKPWIDPAKMAEVRPVNFKARDGLPLNGYLTLPRGRDAKRLPLIIFTKGSPWTRETWQFDVTAQFLANRGYAVLQVNARGSSGYGEPFRLCAHGTLGRELQADYADGARWAIQQQIADPARIGIVGFSSFGGYSALMGLANEPELYRCGAAFTPYTDLVRLIDKKETDPDDYAVLTEWFGDPDKDGDLLRATSPQNLVDKIKAPVLLMHNKDEVGWRYNKTKAMAAALTKAGREVEFINKFDEERYGYQNRAKWLTAIESFFTKHMPAE